MENIIDDEYKEFRKRLMTYRIETLGIETKKAMAEKLEVGERFYAMVERGVKKPSKKFLTSLEKLSGKKEPYWLYGIDTQELDERKVLKTVNNTVFTLLDEELINDDEELSKEIQEILLNALKLDIKHLLLKRKKASK